ncbi:MAG: permease [Elusimicrobiota bacterium]
MISQFLYHFQHYLIEMLPALAIGFLISGIIHEFIPTNWVEKHLGGKGIGPILYSVIFGTLVPICCWGTLPIAISFYQKGASLGSVLAFLVATPATSVTALIIVWRLLGLKFAIYIFFSVIVLGTIMGLIGNLLKFKPKIKKQNNICPHCEEETKESHICHPKTIIQRMKSILKFAYIDMPKEVGLEMLAGLSLASLVNVVAPVGIWIKNYLYGIYGYLFAVIFGLVMYMCATMSVPLVHALVNQGLNIGAGFVLLLVGPITSYGTILVIRKEFGSKILLAYLGVICSVSLILGYLFSFF